MAKTIVVCGYGSGISDAVARRFGQEGFQVALVARNQEKLSSAARALGDSKIKAQGFSADLGDPAAVTKMITDVRASLGPISVIHWNPFAQGAGDFLTADVAELRTLIDVSITGLLVAVQQALPDLRANPGEAAVLVTGGGFGFHTPEVDTMVVNFGVMGLALSKTAQRRVTSLLHEKLKREGIYAGEVVVAGMVKGTSFDQGNATLEASTVANRFFEIYRARTEASVTQA